MPCNTEPCSKVEVVVRRWMDRHPETQGAWEVFDVQVALDIVISIHQSDGVRQLSLTTQQAATTLTPEVEARIIS